MGRFERFSPIGARWFQIQSGDCADSVAALQNLAVVQTVQENFRLLATLAFLLAGRPITAHAADNSAPVHKVDGTPVKEWLVLGPIHTKDIEFDFLAEAGGEPNVRPKEGDIVTTKDGTRFTWTRVRTISHLVNLEKEFGIQDWSVAYAYCELNSDEPVETDLWSHCNYPTPLWLNRKKAGPTPVHSPPKDIPPVLPIQLGAGRNSCLLKLKHEGEEWTFGLQPLPPERATAEFHVTDPGGRNVAGALLEFFDKDKLAGRATTDASGKAEACLYPFAKAYDLRVTSGEMGTWLNEVVLQPGRRRKFDVALTNAVSISGQVLAMDRLPENAIVVQALRVADPSNPGRAALPRRPENGAEQQLSPTNGGKIQSLLPMPAFSKTVHTDTNGVFRFVNLRPGKYRLRCHGADGYVYPEGNQELDASEPIVVEPGRTREGISFVFPEAKKGVWTNYPIRKGLVDLNPRSVHRTTDGMLWVGTDQATLHAFDGVEIETFSSPEIPGNHVYVIDHDTEGTLWIGSRQGLHRLERVRQKGSTGDSPVLVGDPPTGMGAASKPASALANDAPAIPPGESPACSADRPGGRGGSPVLPKDGFTRISITVTDGLPDPFIWCSARTRDGIIWMGTDNYGLLGYDGKAIRLGLRRTSEGVVCEVQDEGPGLSVEDQKKLFGKFVRPSARPTGGEHSTGLGLSIVKKLIEAMNGSVWCESEPGHGAKFVIRLPLAP